MCNNIHGIVNLVQLQQYTLVCIKTVFVTTGELCTSNRPIHHLRTTMQQLAAPSEHVKPLIVNSLK